MSNQVSLILRVCICRPAIILIPGWSNQSSAIRHHKLCIGSMCLWSPDQPRSLHQISLILVIFNVKVVWVPQDLQQPRLIHVIWFFLMWFYSRWSFVESDHRAYGCFLASFRRHCSSLDHILSRQKICSFGSYACLIAFFKLFCSLPVHSTVF